MPRVSIKDSSTTYEIATDEVLYDALEAQGLTLPHGCLAGSCGACKINVLMGADQLSPISTVEQNTIEAILVEQRELNGEDSIEGLHIRLSCRARVKGDISIEPFKN